RGVPRALSLRANKRAARAGGLRVPRDDPRRRVPRRGAAALPRPRARRRAFGRPALLAGRHDVLARVPAFRGLRAPAGPAPLPRVGAGRVVARFAALEVPGGRRWTLRREASGCTSRRMAPPTRPSS